MLAIGIFAIFVTFLVQGSLGGVLPRKYGSEATHQTTIEPVTDLSNNRSTEPTPDLSADLPSELLPPPIDADLADGWNSGTAGSGKAPNENGFFDRIVELLYVMHEFYTLTDSTLVAAMQLLEQVINDVTAVVKSVEQNDEIASKIAELQDFVDQVKQHDPIRSFQFHEEPAMVLLRSLMNILDKFNATSLDAANAFNQMLNSALRKRGLLELEMEIGESYSSYLTKYTEKLEKLKEAIAETQTNATDDEHLKEWLKEMNKLLGNIESIVQFFNEHTTKIDSEDLNV